MKKLLILLSLCLGFFSCKKDSDQGPVPTPSAECRMTESLDSSLNQKFLTYSYDAAGKLIRTDNFDEGILSGYYLVSYSGNKVTIREYMPDNSPVDDVTVLSLNGLGYASTQVSTRLDSSGVQSDTTYFGYNSSGQLSERNYRSWKKNNDGTSELLLAYSNTYDYTDGRVSKSTFTMNGSSSSTNYFYEATSGTVKNNPVFDYSFSESGYFGKLMSDKIPVRSESESSTSKYSYSVNSKGFVTRLRTEYSYFNTTDSFTTLFNYSCP